MHPHEGQLDPRDAPIREPDGEGRATDARELDVSCTHRAVLARAVQQHLDTALVTPGDLADERRERIVAVEDGDAALGQRGDELRLGAGDVLLRAEQLGMRRPDVREHADARPHERAELLELTETAHAHLDDERLGCRRRIENRRRDAELVVLVRLRRYRLELSRQHVGDHVLRRGLATRAADADDGGGKRRAHIGRQRAECSVGVVDMHDARAEAARLLTRGLPGLAGCDGDRRASAQRLADEGVPIDALTAER